MDIYTQVLPTLPPKKFKINVTWNQNSVTLYVNYDFLKNKKQMFFNFIYNCREVIFWLLN